MTSKLGLRLRSHLGFIGIFEYCRSALGKATFHVDSWTSAFCSCRLTRVGHVLLFDGVRVAAGDVDVFLCGFEFAVRQRCELIASSGSRALLAVHVDVSIARTLDLLFGVEFRHEFGAFRLRTAGFDGRQNVVATRRCRCSIRRLATFESRFLVRRSTDEQISVGLHSIGTLSVIVVFGFAFFEQGFSVGGGACQCLAIDDDGARSARFILELVLFEGLLLRRGQTGDEIRIDLNFAHVRIDFLFEFALLERVLLRRG